MYDGWISKKSSCFWIMVNLKCFKSNINIINIWIFYVFYYCNFDLCNCSRILKIFRIRRKFMEYSGLHICNHRCRYKRKTVYIIAILFLQISQKKSNGGNMQRKKLLKILFSTTYLKIIKINKTSPIPNNYW